MDMKKWAAIAALAVLAGCAQAPKKQAFNKEAAGRIKVLAIAQAQREETYEAVVLGHPGMMFGVVGALVAEAKEQAKSRRLTKALNPAHTRLQETLSRKLGTRLAGAGYDTRIVALPADTGEDATIDVLKKHAGNADAVLALSVTGSYLAAGPRADYFPSVVVKVRNVDVKTGKTLYEDTFTYGYSFPKMQTVHFGADDRYRFADIDKLLAEPATTREGLLAGLDPIVARITADLQKN